MMLTDGVEQYVLRRRSEGLALARTGTLLEGLCVYAGSVRLDELTTSHVQEYLDRQKVNTNTWRLKYQALHRFFDYWSARGTMAGFMMPPPRALVRQAFQPYIYSRAELRRLLQVTRKQTHPLRAIDPQTSRTLILLLYGTGALTGEILALQDADVKLDTGTLSIVSLRSNRSRTVPIGPDLKEVLQIYRNWRARKGLRNEHFLVTSKDTPLSTTSTVVCFAKLRFLAGIGRPDGEGDQPRLNDLKFTFAVHRITSWIRNGADLNRMMPALAAYMGQVGLGATDRYLSMTPERFRKELNKLSPAKGKGRWRDNPGLMKLIESL